MSRERIGKFMEAEAVLDEWIVTNAKDGGYLGRIQWFDRWKMLVFHPSVAAIFSGDCLRPLADFMERKTKERKGGG